MIRRWTYAEWRRYAEWYEFANEAALVLERMNRLRVPTWAKRNAAMSAMMNKGHSAQFEAFYSSIRKHETEPELLVLSA